MGVQTCGLQQTWSKDVWRWTMWFRGAHSFSIGLIALKLPSQPLKAGTKTAQWELKVCE
ncbi:MAG: hypothetical protein ACI9ND_000611 [Yoonia sp.]|jgi:hypothetical protein